MGFKMCNLNTFNFLNLPKDLQFLIFSKSNEELTRSIPCVSKYFRELSLHPTTWCLVAQHLRIDAKKIKLDDPKTTCIMAIKQANHIAIQHFFPGKQIPKVHPLLKRILILKEIVNVMKDIYSKLTDNYGGSILNIYGMTLKINVAIEKDQIEVIQFLLETRLFPFFDISHIRAALENRKFSILKLIMENEKEYFDAQYRKYKQENAMIEKERMNSKPEVKEERLIRKRKFNPSLTLEMNDILHEIFEESNQISLPRFIDMTIMLNNDFISCIDNANKFLANPANFK